MNTSPRFPRCCLIACSVLSSLSAWHDLSARAGFDLTELTQFEGQLAAGQQQQAEIDKRVRAARDCERQRDEIAAEVVHGRMTLQQAAARFRELDAACTDGRPAAGTGSRDVPEEAYYRLVIRWVDALPPGEESAPALHVEEQSAAERRENLHPAGKSDRTR